MDKKKIEKVIVDKLNEYRFELPKDEYELVAEELAETIVKNCSIPNVVGRSEQLPCEHPEDKIWYNEKHQMQCNECGEEL
ncbi:MAG TPA: hypothetical protein VKP88_00735 [Candidatus Paceibacterota bacterium]|nr:hypothetical protein [Candidatus Paceibacterota bacterium]